VSPVRAETDASFLFSAGDNVGGSAFESAVQNAEPTIDVLNAMGVDAAAIGNHEYDQGVDDLLDRIEGRTDFPDLAATVTDEDTGEPVHEPHPPGEHGGGRVGVAGRGPSTTHGTA